MITMWTLYWLNVIFSVSAVLAPFIVISAVLVIFGILGKIFDDEFGRMFSTFLKPAAIVLFLTITLSILIPSNKEAIAIYMIPKVVNNEQLQQLPDNALKYLNILFKKEMEEIQKEIGGGK